MKLYIKSEGDELDLIIAATESARELAGMLGLTVGTVKSQISRKRKGWSVIEVEEMMSPKLLNELIRCMEAIYLSISLEAGASLTTLNGIDAIISVLKAERNRQKEESNNV